MAIINLLPPELRQTQRYARRNRALIDHGSRLCLALAVIGAVLLAQIFLLNHSLSSARTNLEAQKSQLAAYASLESEARAASSKLTTLAALQTSHAHWENFFAELSARVPSGIYLTSINSGLTGTGLTITGSARDESQVASFVQALRSWKRLSLITLQNVSPDSDATGFAHHTFTLAATLTPEATK